MSGAEIQMVWADFDLPGIRAGTTMRNGGCGAAPYHSLNLAAHVGDDDVTVAENRQRLEQTLELPSSPCWLNQVHSNEVCRIDQCVQGQTADGSYTDVPGVVLAVLTADCLPVVLAAANGTEVAVVHAGWRGLAAGVIESALACFRSDRSEIQAWLGPAIGVQHYEIDQQVYDAFMSGPVQHQTAFFPSRPGHWNADMGMLARQRLRHAGVRMTTNPRQTSSPWCSFEHDQQFFSYRRDGTTGRMATLVWIEPAVKS